MALFRRSTPSFPRQWNPSIVPTWPVEIDKNHPLANGLVGLYLPGTVSGPRDLTGNGPNLTFGSGVAFGNNAWGAGIIQSVVSAGAYTFSAPSAWQNSTPSIVWVGTNSAAPDANAAYIGLEYNASVTSPYLCYDIQANGNVALAAGWNSGGSFSINPTATGTGPNTGVKNTLACTFNFGTGFVLYQGGAQFLTGTLGSAPSYAGGPVLALGGDSANPSRILRGTTNAGMIYNRILTAAEVALINIAPFSMLRPVVRRAYYLGSAAVVTSTAPTFISDCT